MARLLVTLALILSSSHVALGAEAVNDAQPTPLQEKWGWDMFDGMKKKISDGLAAVHEKLSPAIDSAHQHVTSGWDSLGGMLSGVGDKLKEFKDQAIKKVNESTGLCDKMRPAFEDAESKIKQDLKDQNVQPLDFDAGAGEGDGKCLSTVEADVDKRLTEAATAVGLGESDATKSVVKWFTGTIASGACASKSGLENLQLGSSLDSVCPRTSTLFTVFGHPVGLVNDRPTVGLVVPLLFLSFGFAAVLFRRRRPRETRLLVTGNDEESCAE
jgi:hypothetical protein